MCVDYNKLCGRPPQYAPAPCKLTFDLLILKVVSESRVTCATVVPILVFLGLPVLDLGPMYATERQTSDVRRASSLNAPYPRGGGITAIAMKPDVNHHTLTLLLQYLGKCNHHVRN